MKKRSNLKIMNWQDVTIEQLKSSWETGISELPNPLTFEIARYMNAFAYGYIGGNGIDIRCQYADEVVNIYLNNIKINDIKSKLIKIGWKITEKQSHSVTFAKDSDLVYFPINESNEVRYMTMYVTEKYEKQCSINIEDYYDQTIESTHIDMFGGDIIVSENNIIELFQRVCRENFHNTEDAGAGMRNVYLDANDCTQDIGITIQLYPNDEYHQVWVLHDIDRYTLNCFSFSEQVEYLKKYYNAVC